MASYNLQQQVFTLSMLANLDAGLVDPAPTHMANQLNSTITGLLKNQALTSLIGSWSVDWGPVVCENVQNPNQYVVSGVADQTMVVFKSNNPDSATRGPVYVVAIAGTNFLSHFDQMQEDFKLYPRQAWPPAPAKAQAYISNGTNVGLGILMQMANTQVAGGSSAGKTLQQYLTSVQSKNATLIFTGHSLGGALAPTLALTLYKTPAAAAVWGAVYVYPTAAPNPGGKDFVAAYQEVFPAKVDPVNKALTWNQLVWNTRDMVPHAWDYLDGKDSVFPVLAQLPDLYPEITDKHPEVHACLVAAVNLAKAHATGAPDLPIQFHPISSNPGITGAFYDPSHPPSPYPAPNPTPAAPLGPLAYWFTEAMFQHIYAYFFLLNVSELLTQKILPVQNPFSAGSPLQAAACSLAHKLCQMVCITLKAANQCAGCPPQSQS